MSTLGDAEPSQPIMQGIGPAVVVLIGVLGVAALAAAGYIGGEYVKKDGSVEIERARVHAELALKQAVVNAQIAAGQSPKLDDLTISNGKREEDSRVMLPGLLVLGAACLGAAAYGGTQWQKSRTARR